MVASTLSKGFDFRAASKFIQLASNYGAWADIVITGTWPDPTTLSTVGKVYYNSVTHECKTLMPAPNSVSSQFWQTNASPYGKLLSLLPFTEVSTNYYNIKLAQYTYECFDFGPTIKYFSIDDIVPTMGSVSELDLIPNQIYKIIMYHASIYESAATIKIVRQNSDTSWQQGTANGLSPSGYSVISYRQLGGFTTDASGAIIQNTIWDLSTFKQELLTTKINILNSDNSINPLQAPNIPILNAQNLFAYTDVEGALYETRSLVNSLQTKFYSNKRFGVELKFSALWMVNNTLQLVPTNGITLKITPGFIDVNGTEITIQEDIFLNNSSIRINSGGAFTANGTLGAQDQSGLKIYPGIWRVYITPGGQIVLKEEGVAGGHPIFSSSFYGWYDTTEGNRCLGKFRVLLVSGRYFIEKQSVTETLEENIPVNTVRMYHGTMCPDGLLPCDGLWHDINGYDLSSYTLAQLNSDPTIGNFNWGNSWYEETPNFEQLFLRMTGDSTINTVQSAFNFNTGAGGSADTGAIGGTVSHTHDHIHIHGPGTLNISNSGAHANHTVNFSGETQYIFGDGLGQERVSTSLHTHTVTIAGGDHIHSASAFLGVTDTLANGAQTTTSASNYSPYKDVLFCIKK
jgi:hypothetical protein